MISTEHPLDELDNIAEYLKQKDDDLFEEEKLLMVLPDRISINNVKEKLTLDYSASLPIKIDFRTFENLAIRVLEEKEGRITIAPSEIRRLALVESIQDMTDESVIAEKIWDLIKDSNAPENEQVIKEVNNEFEDFLRCAYPPGLTSGKKRYLERMKKIAKEIESSYYKESSLDALEFYEELEEKSRKRLKEIDFENYYLSRLHVLGESTELLREYPELFYKIFPNIDKIWISAISVFDVSVIEFMDSLLSSNLEIRINIGSYSAERLIERVKNDWDIEVVEEGENLEPDDYNLIESPDMRREIEYIVSDITNKILEEDVNPEDIVVCARDSGQYMPYAKSILEDYGLSEYVQTRRSLALTPAFRLAASVLDLLSSIERNEKIEPSEVSDPLRLGFTSKWGQEPLDDENFLYIESRVGSKGRGKPHKWSFWKSKLKGLDRTGRLDQLIEWIDQAKSNPSTNKLDEILVKFGRGGSSWKKRYDISTGFEEDSENLTDEHITSHANRILSNIHRIDSFARACQEIRGKNEFDWTDIRRAFYATAGSETYGIPQRELDAIKFVDLGNSHFIDANYRYIIGMKSGTFPRKCPSGILLSDEYRKELNSEKSKLYLRGPDTDFENEHDFYEAGTGRDDCNLIFSMPYLDDRGHVEEWSTFVSPEDTEVKHVKASEFVIDGTDKISPRAHWRNSSMKSRMFDSSTENYKDILNNHWIDTEVVTNEILPRMKTFENTILNRKLKIDVDLSEEPYLENLITDIKDELIPAHEINLYEECPLMYYFYNYLYRLGPYQKGWGKGERQFIPEYKDDFVLGPTPTPLRRRHISTKSENTLRKIINNYDKVKNIKNNKSSIIQTINKEGGLEYWSKDRLRKTIDDIIELGDMEDKVKFISSGKTSQDSDIWRPGYIKIVGEQGNTKNMLFIARTTPRYLSNSDSRNMVPHVLNKQYNKDVLIPGSDSYYGSISDEKYDNYKKKIRNLVYDARKIDLSRCNDCVYNDLCGDWGFEL